MSWVARQVRDSGIKNTAGALHQVKRGRQRFFRNATLRVVKNAPESQFDEFSQRLPPEGGFRLGSTKQGFGKINGGLHKAIFTAILLAVKEKIKQDYAKTAGRQRNRLATKDSPGTRVPFEKVKHLFDDFRRQMTRTQ